MSAVGSATYDLAKFVSKILTPYQKDSPSLIVNTSHFIDQVKNTVVDENERLVSFDVKSLFTSVPVQTALDAIRETLDADVTFSETHNISVDTIVRLLRVCLDHTHFQFGDQHYELSDGLAMGSPVSPIVANLFMTKLEDRALATFAKPRPKFWSRFVDDVFSIVRDDCINSLLAHLNNQHRSITFTMEIEKDRRLPFMDITVQRQGRTLVTEVYRKPTHTGRYLSHASHHPPSAKMSVVNALMRRKEYITTNEEAREREDVRIRQDLAANSYPLDFISNAVAQRKNTSKTRADHIATAVIPYCKGTSEAVRRVLASLKVRTVMKPLKVKWRIMRGAKDTIPPKEDPGIVYAVGCSDCPKVYIGETGRTVKKRIEEHRGHLRCGTHYLSAVATHAVEEGHNIFWEPRIIAREKETTRRKIKEAMMIAKIPESRSMNQDRGLELNPLWLALTK